MQASIDRSNNRALAANRAAQAAGDAAQAAISRIPEITRPDSRAAIDTLPTAC